jgi:hypothetical protein
VAAALARGGEAGHPCPTAAPPTEASQATSFRPYLACVGPPESATRPSLAARVGLTSSRQTRPRPPPGGDSSGLLSPSVGPRRHPVLPPTSPAWLRQSPGLHSCGGCETAHFTVRAPFPFYRSTRRRCVEGPTSRENLHNACR